MDDDGTVLAKHVDVFIADGHVVELLYRYPAVTVKLNGGGSVHYTRSL